MACARFRRQGRPCHGLPSLGGGRAKGAQSRRSATEGRGANERRELGADTGPKEADGRGVRRVARTRAPPRVGSARLLENLARNDSDHGASQRSPRRGTEQTEIGHGHPNLAKS